MLIKIEWLLFNSHWGYNVNSKGNCDVGGEVILITGRYNLHYNKSSILIDCLSFTDSSNIKYSPISKVKKNPWWIFSVVYININHLNSVRARLGSVFWTLISNTEWLSLLGVIHSSDILSLCLPHIAWGRTRLSLINKSHSRKKGGGE